ncbi:MAG: extracellular solute-binding protein [Actinomycetota bacterium]
MLTEVVDTVGLTLLSLGIDPERATVEDAERARQRLLEQRDAGIVRGYYGNDYIDGLARGNLWATMAWSGDIFFLRLDNPELEFVVPEEGGIRWVTPLEIPLGAAHPRDAHAFMDFFYRPEIAAQVTEWVGYHLPGRRREGLDLEARRRVERGTREYLEEEQAWNGLFGAVVIG